MSRTQEWYWKNHEHAREQNRERMRRWRAANPERAKAYAHEYYMANRERAADLQRERNYWKAVDELNARRYSCDS